MTEATIDAFVDIALLPDPEFPATTLLNALFSKFHRGLVGHGEGAIGVSFPDVKEAHRGLGSRLRLHGSAADLRDFMGADWLTGMRDHVAIDGPAPVPAGARHRVVRRVQAHSNPERERRRFIARKGVSPEEALAAIPDSRAEQLDLPFILLTSRSTGQQFRLFIEHLPVVDEPQPGTFGSYGLSPTTTIPWF